MPGSIPGCNWDRGPAGPRVHPACSTAFVAMRLHQCDNGKDEGGCVTKRLSRPTAIVLLLAALWSLVLVLAAFFVHIPGRAGSRNLVRTASGAYIEVPIRPQTYF